MNEPFQASDPWRYSGILRPNECIPECWNGEGNCGTRQIAALLGLEPSYIESLVDDIRPNWRKRGMVVADLLALGERLGTEAPDQERSRQSRTSRTRCRTT